MNYARKTRTILDGIDTYSGLTQLREEIEDAAMVGTYVNDCVREYKEFPVIDTVRTLSTAVARRDALTTGADFVATKMAFFNGAILAMRAIEHGADIDLLRQFHTYNLVVQPVGQTMTDEQLRAARLASLKLLVDSGEPVVAAVDMPLPQWSEELSRSDEFTAPFSEGLFAMTALGARKSDIRARQHAEDAVAFFEGQW